MLSWTFFLLALRSYILAWQPKSCTATALDLIFGTFSIALFFLLPKEFHWQSFVVIGAILGITLRFSKPKKFTLSSMIGWSFLYILGTCAAVSCTFFKLTEDKKIAKVILTGNREQTWVTWKNPQTLLEGAWLDSYEVIVQDLKGKELSRQYIYGDLVGLRAEVVTIHWPFHLLGFSNLCHLETLYNGYRTSNRHNLFPHFAAALPFSLPFLQRVWTKLYHNEWKIPGVKSATLESAFFPLITADLKPTQGTYWLIVGNTGLSSIAEN